MISRSRCTVGTSTGQPGLRRINMLGRRMRIVPRRPTRSHWSATCTAPIRRNGSRSACDWGVDRDARERGLFGPSHMPSLMRSDYVTNSNDSYWLSNPKHPLEGFARIIGSERTVRKVIHSELHMAAHADEALASLVTHT